MCRYWNCTVPSKATSDITQGGARTTAGQSNGAGVVLNHASRRPAHLVFEMIERPTIQCRIGSRNRQTNHLTLWLFFGPVAASVPIISRKTGTRSQVMGQGDIMGIMQHVSVALEVGIKRQGWVAHIGVADLIPKCLRPFPPCLITLFSRSLNLLGDPPEYRSFVLRLTGVQYGWQYVD